MRICVCILGTHAKAECGGTHLTPAAEGQTRGTPELVGQSSPIGELQVQ